MTAKSFDSNPNLYVFLPILYLVWSDAVLTPTEVQAINALIDKQGWLSVEEMKFLKSLLDPKSPPTPDQFRSWLSEIRLATDDIDPSSHPRLVDIGIRLAELKGEGSLNPELAFTRESLVDVEETLGLIAGEALFSFFPEKRATLTAKAHTEKTFSVDTMARLLEGEHAATIQKVKTIISDKNFAYRDMDTLEEYRG
ncbi:MAG: acyl-CoA oxidase, partial [Cyclobacteriaceae bacterium]|nr:acyl-CoA oxidase [Cyclobacteriaceae bacterium]